MSARCTRSSRALNCRVCRVSCGCARACVMAATDCGVTVACAVAVARSDCFRARINTGRFPGSDNPCILCSRGRWTPGRPGRAPVGGACGRDSRRTLARGVALR